MNYDDAFISNYLLFLVTLVQVLKEASRLYAASRVRDIGPELRPNDYKKKREILVDEEYGSRKHKEPSTLEDLGKIPDQLSFIYDCSSLTFLYTETLPEICWMNSNTFHPIYCTKKICPFIHSRTIPLLLSGKNDIFI